MPLGSLGVAMKDPHICPPDTLICSAASVWFKGSREHRISSLPGSSVYYSLGFVDVVTPDKLQLSPALALEMNSSQIFWHATTSTILLHGPWLPVISKYLSMRIDLQTTNCTSIPARSNTYSAEPLWYQIHVWFYLYVVTCFDGPVLVLFSADYCLQSNEVSWDMKWRPAEADWYLRAAQNIYRNMRVIFWSLTKARNMQKIRNVHFSILQSWQLFWGSIQDVHFQKYTVVQWFLCMDRSWCVSAETGITRLGFITSGMLILMVNQ